MSKRIEISIVTPCFNEDDNILNCVTELRDAMNKFLPKVSYEHICIDNNSTDSTFKKLQAIASKDKKVKVIAYPAHGVKMNKVIRIKLAA